MENRITGSTQSANILEAPQWYAVYTRSRSEKRLMESLLEKGIEAFVPLRKVIHQWSDRKRLVEEPLIRSYCFVKVSNIDYFEVLNTPGAVRYIWFSGKAASIPDRQINLLKVITGSNIEAEILPDKFQRGRKVIINAGPLTGLIGELVNVSNKKKVIIRIDQLKQVIMITISPLLIELVKEQPV